MAFLAVRKKEEGRFGEMGWTGKGNLEAEREVGGKGGWGEEVVITPELFKGLVGVQTGFFFFLHLHAS